MSEYSKWKRREFLAAGAAAAAVPYLLPSGVLAAPGRKGPNEQVIVGHIGFGGRARGLYHEMGGLRDKGECRSVAVCDVDENRLARAAKEVRGAMPYRDYRYILQRKDIDAVVIGTPDHWHGVHFVHSAESGKHIYCEKPACCTIEESQAMVAAARKAKIASQIGSQGRSQPEAVMMHRYLANGVIGPVSYVECFHYPSPEDDSHTADSDPPPELDWDLWLGPLRWRPYNKRYLHGVFRWLLESGGGQIRDRGAHVMSCAMYWMGADGTGPVTVEATGTPPNAGPVGQRRADEREVHVQEPRLGDDLDPDAHGRAQEAVPGRRADRRGLQAARRHAASRGPATGPCTTAPRAPACTGAATAAPGPSARSASGQPPAGAKEVYASPGHMEDWFLGIRTGKKCIMDIEWGAGVANLCILGNLAYRLGRKLHWDQAQDVDRRRRRGRATDGPPATASVSSVGRGCGRRNRKAIAKPQAAACGFATFLVDPESLTPPSTPGSRRRSWASARPRCAAPSFGPARTRRGWACPGRCRTRPWP